MNKSWDNTLKNGAEVLCMAFRYTGLWIVLAKWHKQWVVWSVDSEGNASWGHYHDTFAAADQTFIERLQQTQT